jgi:hypothetical protein
VSQPLLFSQPALQAIRAHTLLIETEDGSANSRQLQLALMRMSELEGAVVQNADRVAAMAPAPLRRWRDG